MARGSKQTPPSRARDRARHEDEILAAAERLFARKGFASATVVEVAAEAGFAIATLYNRFGSKEAILDALLDRHLAALEREIALAVASAGTPEEKLEASVIARARYLAQNRDFFLVYIDEIPGAHVTAPASQASVALSLRTQLSRIEAIFGELGPSDVDAETRALVFFGATRSYIIERVLKAKKAPSTKEIAAVVRALLRGLANVRERAAPSRRVNGRG